MMSRLIWTAWDGARCCVTQLHLPLCLFDARNVFCIACYICHLYTGNMLLKYHILTHLVFTSRFMSSGCPLVSDLLLLHAQRLYALTNGSSTHNKQHQPALLHGS